MIFGVRHGARADEDDIEYKDVELYFDTHLSQEGIQESRITGLTIQQQIDSYYQYLVENGKTKIQQNEIQAIVISSPFLRSLQTSFQISKYLKRLYKNTIYVQNEFCENLTKNCFSKDPMPNIHLKSKSLDKLCQQYMNIQEYGISLSEQPFLQDSNFITPIFPEQDVSGRIQKAINVLTDHFLQNFSSEKYVLIYVAHRRHVEEGLTLLQYKYKIQSTPTCGLTCVIYNNIKNKQDFKLVLNGKNDHVNDQSLQQQIIEQDNQQQIQKKKEEQQQNQQQIQNQNEEQDTENGQQHLSKQNSK